MKLQTKTTSHVTSCWQQTIADTAYDVQEEMESSLSEN